MTTNKVIATLLLASFAAIFLGLALGDWFYSAGALGTLIFGGLALSKLYRADHHDWYPYVAGAFMLFFWSFAIIAPEGVSILSIPYIAFGITSAVKLLRLSR